MAGTYYVSGYEPLERQPLPRALAGAMAVTYALLGVAVLSSVGVLMAAEEPDGVLLGLLVYGLIPGVLGAVAARCAWRGGVRARWGFLAAHGLYVVQAFGSLGRGDARGLTQLVLPVLALVLLSRASTRARGTRPIPGCARSGGRSAWRGGSSGVRTKGSRCPSTRRCSPWSRRSWWAWSPSA
ncbi:hypothetical protein [Streptomyces indicus]|uniref:hypothetical protein n=1 Tax=Streptomyces indicus TaxID=417292 RepID=UPI000AF3B1AA|nr:hypothetical protein [Streptomyces indicus]